MRIKKQKYKFMDGKIMRNIKSYQIIKILSILIQKQTNISIYNKKNLNTKITQLDLSLKIIMPIYQKIYLFL